MKSTTFFILCLVISFTAISQERFLHYSSKDSINNTPRVQGSLGVNLKLNGYYDIFGGLQNSETFNLGNVNVFGTDDSGSFKMDLYQSQIKLESSFITKKSQEIYAVVEFDFWGGNGKMRLRKAYVEFDHWLIGQTFVPFGDVELWPNILEWEGPPSGVWVRQPMIKYFNTFKNKNWNYTIAINSPITDYVRSQNVEPLIEEAYQNTPDFTLAFKYQKKWGHLRLSSILRNVQYKYDGKQGNFFGYGSSFSGLYIHNKNVLQFQVLAGKGISAYNTSVQGFGYDGFPNINKEIEAMPTYGGWASYWYYFTPKLHSTIVLGYTRYFSNDANRFIITNYEELEQTILINGDIDNWHYYGIVNLMYDPFERMTFGLELDYGTKNLAFKGYADDNYINDKKSRDAMRISFGIMYYF